MNQLTCVACNKQLQPEDVKLEYNGKIFTVSLPVCPDCGAVFIPEEMAIGKMQLLEKALEGK